MGLLVEAVRSMRASMGTRQRWMRAVLAVPEHAAADEGRKRRQRPRPRSREGGVMDYSFANTADSRALRGTSDFGRRDSPTDTAVAFWMNYVWSSFCMQWFAISWCAVVGVESPPTKEAP